MMPRLALLGYLLFAALAFGWRSWLHWRRTGSTGFHGLSGKPGSAEWLGGVLFVLAIVATPLAALLEAAGLLAPLVRIPEPDALAIGGAVYVIGLAGTLWSQLSMGDSWRIGVRRDERTALVMRGPYRAVRNPIFTFMVAGLLGLAVLTPNVLALLSIVALIAAVEIQVKAVEEPHLERAHGDAYRSYRARTGRFVPGLGR
jgi:protein-S-isoprenylcysteine O-methyltransferase Ste14